MREKIKKGIFLFGIAIIMILLFALKDAHIMQAANFTVRNSPPETTNKYYYNSNYNANAASSSYKMPNCTTYVLGRVYEITGKRFEISGNAGDYYKNNKKYKYSDDAYKPQLGAVVCYSSWDKNKYGHVQVVEKIGSDSKGAYICVSESNYSGRESGKGALSFNYMKIYLKDLANSTSLGKTYRTLLEDNDGYNSSKELYSNYTETKFQGYIYAYDESKSSEIVLNKSNATIDVGEIIILKVISDIQNGKSIDWKCTNKEVVSFSSDGKIAYVTGMKSGTATITAVCGNQVATCNVTVKGNSSAESTIKITNDGATNIKETTARLNASISPGRIIEEAGFYWGTSKDKLTQVKESVNSYTTNIWYDLGTGKWTKELKPNTTYYYQMYVKVNGKTYKTDVSSFKTAEGESYTLTNSSVTNLKTTSAKISATLSPGVKIEKAGFYYGKSSDKLTKKTETVNAYTESIWYELGTGKWCDALSPNTTYYYQIYVVINGTEYKSKLSKFTTASYKIKENSDKFSNLKALDITKTSAKISTDYPKKTYDDAGFYFGTSADVASMKKTSEYVHGGSPSVSYTNSYKLGVKYDGYGYKWADPLKEGTKYYYAFYLVLDGTEYISKVKSFITKGTATIENVEMVSYPTKRDYVVGEKIDTSGMKIKVTYSDGTTKTVTSGVKVSGDASEIGTRQISLKFEGKTFKYNITVKQPLKGITLNKKSATLDVDDVLALTVKFNPTDTTDSREVKWKSSNTNVVTVSKGMVTAVGSGTATITATCGSQSATCTVTVKVPVAGVSLNKTSIAFSTKGEKTSLVATTTPSNAANKNVSWVSSDTSVAKVSGSGVVEAVGEGVATISVTTESGNMTAVCIVAVDYPDINNNDDNNSNDVGEKEEDKNAEADELESDAPVKDNSENIEVDSGEESEEIIEDEVVEDVIVQIQDGNVCLVEKNVIGIDEIRDLVETNGTKIVQIKNTEGVTFTFPIGYMEEVNDIKNYDFSASITTNPDDMETMELENTTCVLHICYTYSGNLPGAAMITIPVGVEWCGHRLYYYQVLADGTCQYTGKSAVVDEEGNYTIVQKHCSDYVLSTTEPSVENVPDDGGNDVGDKTTVRKPTGMDWGIIGVLVLLGGMVCVFIKKIGLSIHRK